jgi:hypothetical protein
MEDTDPPAAGWRPSWADLDASTAATAAAMADPAASPLERMKAAEAEEALFLAARAAGWQLADDRPFLAAPQEYVTEVSVPGFGDSGCHSLHSVPLRQPGPEPEIEV